MDSEQPQDQQPQDSARPTFSTTASQDPATVDLADRSRWQRTLATRLTRLWGMKLPIVGAPMAGRTDATLAAAVSIGGGMGMFGAGAKSTREWIIDNARRVEQLIEEYNHGNGLRPPREGRGAAGSRDAEELNVDELEWVDPKNYGIGLMIFALEDNPEQWEAVLEARPKVVSLGFGDPTPFIEQAHEAGISVVSPVNDEAQLRQALDAGVDALTLQGADAGGHTGHISTMVWMQMALAIVENRAPGIPTAVAGGIGSGRGLAAVLAAGADAAWIGTGLLASPESTGTADMREMAVRAGARDTVLTDIYDRAEQVPWDTETWPTRTLKNPFTDVYAEMSRQGDVTDEELISARKGEFAEDQKLHVGQSVGLVHSERPASEVVKAYARDAVRFLTRP